MLKDAPLRGLAQAGVNAGDQDCVEHMEKQACGTKADYRQPGGFAVHLLEVMFAVHERQLRPVTLVLPHAAAFRISARMMPGKPGKNSRALCGSTDLRHPTYRPILKY